jgi:hypothetical protein
MITVFAFPELFEPVESLFPVRVRKAVEADTPKSFVDALVPSTDVPADFEFVLRVLIKEPELRTALFKAMRDEGFPMFD